MLHLNFAPSIDLLVPILLQKLREVWTDPFNAPDILVANPAQGKWLTMRLAGSTDDKCPVPPLHCVANLRMPTIEKFLWNLLSPEDAVMLDQQHLQQILCALLDEECIRREEFEPVKAYLLGPDGIDPLKRVQLSARLAHQFLEYEYNRPGVWRKNGEWNPPGIDGAWMHRKLNFRNSGDETWQSELYRRMRHCFSCDDSSESRYLTLPQLYRLRKEKGTADSGSWSVPASDILIFGVTKVSHFHRNLLVEISQIDGVNMHLYLTNPCAEFWEDVNTSRGTIRRSWNSTTPSAAISPRKSDDYHKEELTLFNAGAPPADQKLLELWGNAGKENIFLWCQDAAWNFDYHTSQWTDEHHQPSTVLKSLQLALLQRRNELEAPVGGLRADRSLQILACPDPGREMEEIRERILDAIYDGTVSMLNEIVVYLPDPAAYTPYIQRVFGRFSPFDPEFIPFCILGASGKETRFAQGIQALFKLLTGQFDRSHVFDFLRNPLVQHSRKISADTIPVWETWAEELAIFRGMDRTHRQEMGDCGQTRTDAHTFGLGIARMVLADLIESPVTIDFFEQPRSTEGKSPVPLPVIPWRDFATTDRNNLELFCATIDTLAADSRRLRACVKGDVPQAAVDTLHKIVTYWFADSTDAPGIDTVVESNIRNAFLDGITAIPLQTSLAGRTRIPFEEFITLAAACLPEDGPVHSGAWTGGITFAPLTPSMILPHTMVVAAGLDESMFPGPSDRPSWDLLAKNRIVGDFDPVRANRFAFLELLHAARKRLVLSYRSRNMQKEEELHPSSVILELEVFLSDHGLVKTGIDGKQACAVSHTVPWIVHESLRTAETDGKAFGTWNRTESALARIAATTDRVKHRYDLDKTASVPPPDPHTLFRISDYDIREYFKNPLEYHLSKTLSIDNIETASTLLATDEPVSSDSLSLMTLYTSVWTRILRRVFPQNASDAVTDPVVLERIAYDEMVHLYTLHAAAGRAPEAMMEELEYGSLTKWARSCIQPVMTLYKMFAGYRLLEKTDLSLGREESTASLELSLRDNVRCTITGSHPLVLLPENTAEELPVLLLSLKSKGKACENADLCIRGALQVLHNHDTSQTYPAVNLAELDWNTCALSMAPIDDSKDTIPKIREWITILGAEIYDRRSEFLPFRIIQNITGNNRRNPKPWKERLAKVTGSSIVKALDDPYGFRSYKYAFDLVDALPPDLDDETLQKHADERFGPILDGWLFGEEPE